MQSDSNKRKHESSSSTIVEAMTVIDRMVSESILEERSELWCFAVSMIENGVRREIFLNIEDDDSKDAWLMYLQAKSNTTLEIMQSDSSKRKHESTSSTIVEAMTVIDRMVSECFLEERTELWCFAVSMIENEVRREIFLNIEDDESKKPWLMYLQAKSNTTLEIMQSGSNSNKRKHESTSSTIVEAMTVIDRMVSESILEERSELWCFAVSMIENGVRREIFLNIEDDDSKDAWLMYLQAKEK